MPTKKVSVDEALDRRAHPMLRPDDYLHLVVHHPSAPEITRVLRALVARIARCTARLTSVTADVLSITATARR